MSIREVKQPPLEEKEEKDDKSDVSSTDMSNDEDDIESIEEDEIEDNDFENEEEEYNDIEEENITDENELDIENDYEDGALEELENEDEDDITYQKIEDYVSTANLEKLHPEIKSANYDEINSLSRVVRDATGKIIDPLHTTPPFITKYEKARIIGTRTEQLESGAMPYIEVESHIINGRTIAIMEYEQKKIPFIIARPLPNKCIEYWRLDDLEFL